MLAPKGRDVPVPVSAPGAKQTAEHTNRRFDLVAFDLGGVLYDVDVNHYLDSVAALLSVEPSAVAAATFNHDIWTRAEVGQLDEISYPRAILEALGKKPEAALVAAVASAWCSILWVRPQTYDLLQRLQCRRCAWSNTDPLHLKHICTVDKLGPYFEYVVASCEVGVEKPDLAFFSSALLRANTAPKRILYFDDRIENVEAAASLGVHARHTDSLAVVQSDLVHFGVLA